MKDKICIIFGGSGYIGTYLIIRLLKEDIFDKIYVFDKNITKNDHIDKVLYYQHDVIHEIDFEFNECDVVQSWVFNLAAVHREPGHEDVEYFDTNINGALNINHFLEKTGINNLFFTSSIAPYGKSMLMRDENSQCYPQTPYGISKWKAESIHQTWRSKNNTRRLIICRPGVIYGPGDPGNMLRMIKGVKNGMFFIPGNPNVIKAHGYIYGLIDSIIFTLNKSDREILYNYSESPSLNIGEMIAEIKKVFNISRPVPRFPLFLLVLISSIISFVFPKSPIHPVRVKKAAFPTNVKPGYLIDNNFQFNYPFRKSIEHWINISPKDFE
jgi:nucleoside-diphosphate-sugar epimerase